MAAFTSNKVCDNSSLANFKSWAQTISSAFSTLGWVQTADTGQVNWGTIVSVPASTYVYEIWKANDASAGTMPIYVKVEYGFSATVVQIRMTVGTGSSGAGVITGIVVSSAPWQITNSNANQGATTYPCYFSGHAGEFRMWMWGNPTAAPAIGVFFGIERSKDTSGADTAEYITISSVQQSVAGASFNNQQTLLVTGAGNRDGGIIGLALGSTSGTGLAFGTVAAFPVFPILGKVGNPMLGIMSCYAVDAAVNSIVTVTSMYGGTHTFLCIGGNNLSVNMGQRSNTGATISGLMRYE